MAYTAEGFTPSVPRPRRSRGTASAGAAATRDRLLDAAEELFATHGVDAVSLRQVVAAAGVGNASALQYHFGDRDGLLAAVVDRHTIELDREHHRLLAAAEADRVDLVQLVEALVRPLADRLATPSGRRYLLIQAELALRSTPASLRAVDPTERSGFDRWRLAVEPFLDPAAVAAHGRFIAFQVTVTELANWIRRVPPNELDVGLVGDRVVSLALAVLTAPMAPPAAPPDLRDRPVAARER